MTMSVADLGPEQIKLAHTWLRDRRARAGEDPDAYSASELSDAYSRAMRGEFGVSAAALEEALAEAGHIGGAVVTEALLATRASEILAERGTASPDDELEALRAAIAELGKPGETRRDLAVRVAETRDEFVDAAINDGLYLEASRDVLVGLYDANPAATRASVQAMREHPSRTRFESSNADGIDGDGLHLHRRAEQILVKAGKAKADHEGVLGGYEAQDYEWALAEVDREDKLAARAAKEAKKAAA